MPRLSDSMEEGTILKWLKAEGDEVARGDELVEIETDKATMTYEADSPGTLAIVAQEGETLPIGQVIARIGAGGEASAGESAQAEATQTARRRATARRARRRRRRLPGCRGLRGVARGSSRERVSRRR